MLAKGEEGYLAEGCDVRRRDVGCRGFGMTGIDIVGVCVVELNKSHQSLKKDISVPTCSPASTQPAYTVQGCSDLSLAGSSTMVESPVGAACRRTRLWPMLPSLASECHRVLCSDRIVLG